MLKLYQFESSPYSWMVRAALAEKKLPYDSAEPRDRDTNPELRGHNPLNKTPVLVDGGAPIFESFSILQYLEEKYPKPPLMPADPAERARARSMCLIGYLYIYPESSAISRQLFQWNGWSFSMGPYPPRKPSAEVDSGVVGPAEDRLAGYWRIIDQELAARPWVTGASFGLADIVLAPTAAAYRLRGGPIEKFGHLNQWLDRCLSRPSIREAATPVVRRGTPV